MPPALPVADPMFLRDTMVPIFYIIQIISNFLNYFKYFLKYLKYLKMFQNQIFHIVLDKLLEIITSNH